jgi:hypothetical protein
MTDSGDTYEDSAFEDSSFDEPSGRGRRFVFLVMAAVVAGVAVWMLLGRGGDDGPDIAVSTPVVGNQAAEPTDEAAVPAGDSPIETFQVFAPKDPFEPLVSVAPAQAASTSPTTTGQDAGVTSEVTTTPGISESDGTTTITTDNSGASGGGSNGHRVKVIDVFKEDGSGRAQVQVDGTVYTITEDERFAGSFQLISASNACATMLFGDDEFTLCEGEEILK